MGQQVGQRAVEVRQVVFGFQARGTKEVADIVRRGKADREVVRRLVLAELFFVQQRLSTLPQLRANEVRPVASKINHR
jgi:hypothetical protein